MVGVGPATLLVSLALGAGGCSTQGTNPKPAAVAPSAGFNTPKYENIFGLGYFDRAGTCHEQDKAIKELENNGSAAAVGILVRVIEEEGPWVNDLTTSIRESAASSLTRIRNLTSLTPYIDHFMYIYNRNKNRPEGGNDYIATLMLQTLGQMGTLGLSEGRDKTKVTDFVQKVLANELTISQATRLPTACCVAAAQALLNLGGTDALINLINTAPSDQIPIIVTIMIKLREKGIESIFRSNNQAAIQELYQRLDDPAVQDYFASNYNYAFREYSEFKAYQKKKIEEGLLLGITLHPARAIIICRRLWDKDINNLSTEILLALAVSKHDLHFSGEIRAQLSAWAEDEDKVLSFEERLETFANNTANPSDQIALARQYITECEVFRQANPIIAKTLIPPSTALYRPGDAPHTDRFSLELQILQKPEAATRAQLYIVSPEGNYYLQGEWTRKNPSPVNTGDNQFTIWLHRSNLTVQAYLKYYDDAGTFIGNSPRFTISNPLYDSRVPK